jgi:hypothetical protein
LSNPAEPARRARNSHIFARARNDLYVEALWCSERLLAVETFPGTIWDPCEGTGTIPKAARAAGLKCVGSDLSTGHNFLTAPALVRKPFSVVTNPPYALAPEIVERALELGAVKVAFLFPVARVNAAWRWPEPMPLARLYLLTPRPSVPPLTAKVVGGGRVDFCWLVLDQRHKGPPTLGWLHRDGESSRLQLQRGPNWTAAQGRAANVTIGPAARGINGRAQLRSHHGSDERHPTGAGAATACANAGRHRRSR